MPTGVYFVIAKTGPRMEVHRMEQDIRNVHLPTRNPEHISIYDEDYRWELGDPSLFSGAEKVEDVYDREGNYVGSMVYWPGLDGEEGSTEWVEAENLSGEIEEIEG